MRRGLVFVCVLALTGCGILRGGPPGDPDTVAEALVDAEAGDVLHVEGQISLLGELFCPCFWLTSGGATVVVWYGLTGNEVGEREAVDVAGFGNGDPAYVEGELRPDPDPGSGHPVVWAFGIWPPDEVEPLEE
jgi:hypothetical protein